MSRSRAARAAVLASLALGATMLTSCDDPPEPPPPTFAVLTATGSTAEKYLADVEVVTEAATAAGGALILSTVGDHTAESLLFHETMAGEGANKLERDTDIAAKQEEMAETLSGVAAGADALVHDVLVAFETLAGNLVDTDGAVHVVVAAPLANGGNPNPGDPAVLADAVGTLNELAAQGRIPDCDGWLIYGVGESTTSVALREFYRLYAERCGGKLVAFTTHLVEFPIATAIEAPDYTQIDVDQDGDAVVATVHDVAFEYGSAEISPAAQPSLLELLEWVESTPGQIEIVGHTDERGDAEPNLLLSELRAQRIAQFMIDNGIPEERIRSVRGAGETELLIPAAATEAEHSENRRVTVAVHPDDAADGS